MKLQSFLKEESLADIDISEFTKSLTPEYTEAIKKLFARFKSYSKISLNDVREDDMFFHISNGLIDFDFKDESDFFAKLESD